jgi:hypothetical protein
MTDTVRQYKDYAITSLMKTVEPVVVATADGCTIRSPSMGFFVGCCPPSNCR